MTQSASAPASPYARKAPSPQQTLDIFKGNWASRMPESLGPTETGNAGLFADPRVGWANEALRSLGSGFVDRHVLELGPLEGGHTFMLSKLGAKSVTAVEAHPQAFQKCLIVKELLGIERVNFLFGDALEFLKETPYHYDVAFCCGLLYHMSDPVTLIREIARKSSALFLWTVYWDKSFSDSNPQVPAGSGPVRKVERDGQSYSYHAHDYGSGFDYGKFWGGSESMAQWMELDDILRALDTFGFCRRHHELEANPNGCALRLVATKT